jgi:hypothetical protein
MRSIDAVVIAVMLCAGCEQRGDYDAQLTIDVAGLDRDTRELPFGRGGRIDVTIYACVGDLPAARAELRNVYVAGDASVSTTFVTLVSERPIEDAPGVEEDAGTSDASGPTCPGTRLVGRASLMARPGPVLLEAEALGQHEELEFILGDAPTIVVMLGANPPTPIGDVTIVDLSITAPDAPGTPFVLTTLPPVPTTLANMTLSESGTGMATLAIPEDIGAVRVSVSIGGGPATTYDVRRTMP